MGEGVKEVLVEKAGEPLVDWVVLRDWVGEPVWDREGDEAGVGEGGEEGVGAGPE